MLREQITGIRVVRAFVREPQEEARFSEANADLTEVSLRAGRLMSMMFPTVNFLINASSVGVLWLGASRVNSGQIQVGSLIAYLSYLVQILMSVVMATFVISMIPRASVSADRIQEVLDTDPSVVPPVDPVRKVVTPGALEFENVGFHYPGAEHPVLSGVSFATAPGQTTAVVGSTGAGKTTLVNLILRLFDSTEGTVKIGGVDVRDVDPDVLWNTIGLVPQELTTDAFESVWATVKFSRGLFGKPPNPAYLEKVLRDLSLWEKRDSKIMTLSGGMKRRVMIAKALSHEPRILFLDEPTAGVDVELRRAMWDMVRGLRESGVTIILTTHYIQEAQEMADRIGVINKGQIILIEDKAVLMKKLGSKKLTLQLRQPLQSIPAELADAHLELISDGTEIVYTFDTQRERTGIPTLLSKLSEHGISIKDLQTSESSLEDIFVSLVSAGR